MSGPTHVYPVNDLREHELEGEDCWCHPDILADGGIVLHHAAAGRAQPERGAGFAH